MKSGHGSSAESTLVNIHPRCKPCFFQPNGRLLDNPTIKSIKKEIEDLQKPELITYTVDRLNRRKLGRYSKSLFDISYGIIYGLHGIYAIYKETTECEVSDPGAYGKIKIAQNLITGEFYILKTQWYSNPHRRVACRNEHRNLEHLGLTREPLFIRRSKKTQTQKCDILMTYFRGEEIFQLMVKRYENIEVRMWPDLCWLEIALQVAKATARLRDILHRDIKPENFIYCLADNKAYAIDLGWSEKITILYCGYRLLEGYNAPEVYSFKYSEKSEVFALSTLLQELLFNQVVPIHFNSNAIRFSSPKQYTDPCFINLDSDRKTVFEADKQLYPTPTGEKLTIKHYLEKMRNKNPDLRPSRIQVVRFFQHVHKTYFENPLFKKEVSIVRKLQKTAQHDEMLRIKKINQEIAPQAFFKIKEKTNPIKLAQINDDPVLAKRRCY